MKIYELIPQNGIKSFCGKAQVFVNEDGSETLFSYNTRIMTRRSNGELVRHWAGWSVTTGSHISSFAGIKKKKWDAMDVE